MALITSVAIFSLPSYVYSDVSNNNINNPYPHASTSTKLINNLSEPRTIKYYAQLYNVDYSLAKRIARCESHFDPSIDNPNSTASGLYQFLDGSWERYGKLKWGSLDGKNVYNYGDNAELAMWVMSKYGTHDWDASKGCWG